MKKTIAVVVLAIFLGLGVAWGVFKYFENAGLKEQVTELEATVEQQQQQLEVLTRDYNDLQSSYNILADQQYDQNYLMQALRAVIPFIEFLIP